MPFPFLSRSLAAAAVALLAFLAVPGAPATHAASRPPGGARLAAPGLLVDVPAGVAAPPEVSAASWLVADAGTGEVLAARDARVPRRPASVLKLLTALALFDRLDATSTYTAVFEDANVEGSKVGIVPGSTYTVDQLWQALFMMSGNDAANALANAAGGVPATVDRMNAVARTLQARDTRAVNPSGLDADGQVTTAYDLALIASAALRVPGMLVYAQGRTGTFPGAVTTDGTPRSSFRISTKQAFLRNYEGAIGLKNGFTSLARQTYVAAATRGGRTLLVVTLMGESKGGGDAAALADWAFAAAGSAEPVGELLPPLPADPGPSVSPSPAATGSPDPATAAPSGAEWTPAVSAAADPPLSAAADPAAAAVGDGALADRDAGWSLPGDALPIAAIALLGIAGLVILARA